MPRTTKMHPPESTNISERKAHQGLMREDLLVLRHIFNLNHGIHTLDEPFKSLSIDVENPYISQLYEGGKYQIGLSVLDTRQLQDFIYDRGIKNPLDLLQTYQFCIRPGNYAQKAARMYCFGESQRSSLDYLRFRIQGLVSDRDVVLVLHGGHEDLVFLEAAAIDLNPLYVLNTQKVAQHPLDLDHRCTLEELLTRLKCPVGEKVLHVAGNDANYTLRALLLIVCVDAAAAHQMDDGQKKLLTVLEEIAMVPAPRSIWQTEEDEKRQREIERIERRKEKRAAKRLKARILKEEEGNEEMDISNENNS